MSIEKEQILKQLLLKMWTCGSLAVLAPPSGAKERDCQRSIAPRTDENTAQIEPDQLIDQLVKFGAVVIKFDPHLHSNLKSLLKSLIQRFLRNILSLRAYDIEFQFKQSEKGLLLTGFSIAAGNLIEQGSPHQDGFPKCFPGTSSCSPEETVSSMENWGKAVADLITQPSQKLLFTDSSSQQFRPELQKFEVRFHFPRKKGADVRKDRFHHDGDELVQTVPIFGLGTPYLVDSSPFRGHRGQSGGYIDLYPNDIDSAEFGPRGSALFFNGAKSPVSDIAGVHGVPFLPGQLRVLIVAKYRWKKIKGRESLIHVSNKGGTD